MAQNHFKVLLGFEDELITEKYKNQVNFTTNKIGGKPDLTNNLQLDLPICPLCQLPRPLILQIYAPLETSPFHRTLYLFACINSNCWNQNDSWVCIRSQSQEKLKETEGSSSATFKTNATEWCADADDWDDDNNANGNEENGNLTSNIERISDEDDESCSFEESIRAGLGNLTVDDRNANNGALGGAVGRLHSPSATAEIEGDEGEVISIDSPTIPQHNIAVLLQEVTPLPRDLYQNIHSDAQQSSFQFVSSFVTVWEETSNTSNISDRHVKELLQEYQQNNEDESNLSPDKVGASAQMTDNAYEKYEKSNPVHGDKMFHGFLSRIQMNPGQILRYSRDAEAPILLYPLQDYPKKCSYCQGDLVFELQVLPTIIPKLKLISDAKAVPRIDFGTVLIFTCRKSCWSTDTNLRYETVVVQSELY